jgi:hypothetical protein
LLYLHYNVFSSETITVIEILVHCDC